MYDEGERCWKIPVYDQLGNRGGVQEISTAIYVGSDGVVTRGWEDRHWRGKPQAGHFETLYRWKWSDDEYRYLLLIHLKQNDFTDDDYFRETTLQSAAKWLVREDFVLPDDLQKYAKTAMAANSPLAGQNPVFFLAPLTEAQQEVMDRLENRVVPAKQLAKEILNDFSKADVIRKRIEAIRKTGRGIGHHPTLGYFRPDAPPPEFLDSPHRKSA